MPSANPRPTVLGLGYGAVGVRCIMIEDEKARKRIKKQKRLRERNLALVCDHQRKATTR